MQTSISKQLMLALMSVLALALMLAKRSARVDDEGHDVDPQKQGLKDEPLRRSSVQTLEDLGRLGDEPGAGQRFGEVGVGGVPQSGVWSLNGGGGGGKAGLETVSLGAAAAGASRGRRECHQT